MFLKTLFHYHEYAQIFSNKWNVFFEICKYIRFYLYLCHVFRNFVRHLIAAPSQLKFRHDKILRDILLLNNL